MILMSPADDPAWQATQRLDLDGVLSSADVISIHLPLTPETRGLIGKDAFARMKTDAVLVNAARGGVMDEEALVAALKGGKLGGAALDVFEEEPLRDGAKIFAGTPNLILTPHIAGNTVESNGRVSGFGRRARHGGAGGPGVSKLSLEQAEARLAELFVSAGASSANAASVAWALVMAEADGLKGHGLSRVPTYLAMLRSGKIDGQAVPIASRPQPGVLAIDACHGFAYPAIDLAIGELPDWRASRA
jgi:hypothetical protein